MSIDQSDSPAPEAVSGAAKLTPPGPGHHPPPPKGQFTIQYPLTSFASTPHNVACIAFLLGAVWSLGLASAAGVLFGKHFVWSPSAGATSLEPQGLKNALLSPFLGFYLASWALFHLLEFVVTSLYNPGKLSVSCECCLLRRHWRTRALSEIRQHTCSTMVCSTTLRMRRGSPSTCSRKRTFRQSGASSSTSAASSSSVNVTPNQPFDPTPTDVWLRFPDGRGRTALPLVCDDQREQQLLPHVRANIWISHPPC